MGEGYKQTKKVDEAIKVAEKVLAMPVDVKVTDFATAGSGATLSRDRDRPRGADGGRASRSRPRR